MSASPEGAEAGRAADRHVTVSARRQLVGSCPPVLPHASVATVLQNSGHNCSLAMGCEFVSP
jgi:hypothetical protein